MSSKIGNSLLILIKAFLWMLVCNLPMIIGTTVYSIKNKITDPAALNGNSFQLISLFATGILIVVLYYHCKKKYPGIIQFESDNAIIKYGKGYVAGILLIGLAWGLSVIFGATQIEWVFNFSKLWIIMLFFLGYLIQGMSEEVLLRGYVMGRLQKYVTPLASVIISALFFAVLHGANPSMSWIAFLNLFLFGLFMGFIRLNTTSLWFVGALHSAWNFFQGNIFGINVSGLEINSSFWKSVAVEGKEFLNGGGFGLEGGLLTSTILVIGLAYVLLRVRKNPQVLTPNEMVEEF